MATKSGAGGLVYSVVAIAIIVLIVSTVAVPVIEDSTDGIKISKQNSGQMFALTTVNDSKSYSFSYDSESGYVTVNDYSFKPTNGSTLAFTDSIYVFFQNGMRAYADNDVTAVSTSSIVFASGVASWNISGVEYTASYTYAFLPDPNGTYGAFKSGDVIKFNADSKLVYTGANQLFTNSNLDPSSILVRNLVLYGTYDNFDSLWARSTTEGITYISLNSDLGDLVTQFDDGHMELTVGSNWQITAETNLGDYTRLTTLITVIAPLEYWVHDSNMVSLFGVVTIILFLVPVMMAVRMIQTRRN